MYFVQANMSATAVFGLNLTLPRVFFWLCYQSGNSFVMNMVDGAIIIDTLIRHMCKSHKKAIWEWV